LVEAAIDYWRACPNYGASFPAFVVGGNADRSVTLESADSSGDDACASFHRGTIRLFDWAVPAGRVPERCTTPAANLAHELGHVLGLEDARTDSACADRIMAAANSRRPRAVSSEECRLVGHRWLTRAEQRRAGGD
ncbi:MAG: hypothetical protein R3190_10655, partial [Thermoanaerobaculia bacterium]|nr:hypothetical protein [Thermoanaerobaculia bacterium]